MFETGFEDSMSCIFSDKLSLIQSSHVGILKVWQAWNDIIGKPWNLIRS